MGKIYQMTTKCTKWPQNVPNGHKIYLLAVNRQYGHKKYQPYSLQDLPNLTQIGILVRK
jgi:ubiquitin